MFGSSAQFGGVSREERCLRTWKRPKVYQYASHIVNYCKTVRYQMFARSLNCVHSSGEHGDQSLVLSSRFLNGQAESVSDVNCIQVHTKFVFDSDYTGVIEIYLKA